MRPPLLSLGDLVADGGCEAPGIRTGTPVPAVCCLCHLGYIESPLGLCFSTCEMGIETAWTLSVLVSGASLGPPPAFANKVLSEPSHGPFTVYLLGLLGTQSLKHAWSLFRVQRLTLPWSWSRAWGLSLGTALSPRPRPGGSGRLHWLSLLRVTAVGRPLCPPSPFSL